MFYPQPQFVGNLDGIYNNHSQYVTSASRLLGRIRHLKEEVQILKQVLGSPFNTNPNITRSKLNAARKELKKLEKESV